MLTILADTFRTATRTEIKRVNDIPAEASDNRWLPKGHWFVQTPPRSDRNKR